MDNAKRVFEVSRKKGITHLTEVQRTAIPIIEKGFDCLVIAPTGFGKTEAAVLPLLTKLLQATEENQQGVQLLYITPLRSLNRDMLLRMTHWCEELGITLGVRHGDTTQTERKKQNQNPPRFLITTPESLNALLVSQHFENALGNVRFVVVDEVHDLIQNKRGVQLSLALERLQLKAKQKIQRIGLSATVGCPKNASRFISPNAKIATMTLQREINLSIETPTGKKQQTVAFPFTDQASSARVKRIKDLIEAHGKTLVFVNTRSNAESLTAQLFQIPQLKERVAVHHSSISKNARIDTEQDFKQKKSKLKALVCTSSLELGIDIGGIDLVIQLVSPRQATRLLQRVGRSGHGKHLVPKGVIISVNELDAVESIVVAKNAKQGRIEKPTLPQNNLDVLAHQLAGLSIDKEEGFTPKQAVAVFKKAAPYENLQQTEVVEVANLLVRLRTLSFDEKTKKYKKMPKTLFYYYENLSTIADSKKFFVKDASTKNNLGVLDESFVGDYLHNGSVFISRGKPWKVLAIHDEEIITEPSDDYSAAIPAWRGEELPVSMQTAQQTARLLEKTKNNQDAKKQCFENNCAQNTLEETTRLSQKQREFFTPNPNQFTIEPIGKIMVLHSFFGNKFNETLARITSALFNATENLKATTRANQHNIIYEFRQKTSPEKLASILREITPSNAQAILKNTLPKTPLFRYKFTQVAKRFGAIPKKTMHSHFVTNATMNKYRNTPVFQETFNEVFTDKLALDQVKQIFQNPPKTTVLSEKQELSPLAKSVLQSSDYSELLTPQEPTEQILRKFKEELLKKTTRLYCTFCGSTQSFKLSDAEHQSKITCKSCGSTQLTVDEKYHKTLEKKQANKKLNADEKKQAKDAFRVATLVSTFGPRALLALETFGVGPENASRLLSRMHKNKENYYYDLLNAQKTFIKNKKYWKT